ncbi:muscle-specific protein 20 [Folsomia candida]|uniref:Muscle-specific protein 20 n=1 Tax=Folsomia candida TaxID=158441 RepID=A0A226E072_FOLCA|nr:muscle-specific protein 20 [Folsomia candida]OXA50648.1 Muscle-specific protein 20 [Folsomia candida]
MSKSPWKISGIRDPDEEAEAAAWVQQVVGEQFPPVPYEDILRNGIVLCKLINRLQPGIIKKVNTSGGDYKFIDNIQQFLKAAADYGVPVGDLFEAPDLYERKNIPVVTKAIFSLGRTTYKHPEWQGPWLGPKPADENLRHFSEDVLRAGQSIIGLQAGQNKGASQAGSNLGAQRRILLGK